MPKPLMQMITAKIAKNPLSQFWALHISYWLLVAVITFFSITVWYEQVNSPHIIHTLVQSLFGIICSLPLYWVFMRIWNLSHLARLSLGFTFVIIVSLIWTIARLKLFIIMLSTDDLWQDFGGWYWGSVFIFLCWTGFFHGIKYYQLLEKEHEIMLKAAAKAKEEQLKRVSAQSIARNAQIRMLRYQLNPHFLCNSLNAINALIETGATEKAQRMSVQLSEFLRYCLDNNPDTKITLQDEIKALNLYLDIEKTRFGERLQLDFKVNQHANLACIPSLLLQPLIENSMKHVIAINESGGTIKLRADIDDNSLVLKISDTGAGLPIKDNKFNCHTRRGHGLRNIEERLKVLYNQDYTFTFETIASGGLTATIKIPYETL